MAITGWELLTKRVNKEGDSADWNWREFPAKMAVYLLVGKSEGGESPLLLATVGDLRAALQRRLGKLTEAEKGAEVSDAGVTQVGGKRVRYGEICTGVCFRQVQSALEANWIYWQLARQIYPGEYKKMIPWKAAQYVGIDLREKFPKFKRMEMWEKHLSGEEGGCVGPITERRGAEKLIEALEDLFDLCRYHQILVQAPAGKACSYKEMGKCPAPCDGTVTLEEYYAQLRAAWDYLGQRDQSAWWRQQEVAMAQAAGKLDFEQAGKIKQKLKRAEVIGGEAYQWMREWTKARYLGLLPGVGKNGVTPCWIAGSKIALGDSVKRKELPGVIGKWWEKCVCWGQEALGEPGDAEGQEQLGLMAYHLFKAGRDGGSYLPLEEVLGDPMGCAGLQGRVEKYLDERKAVTPMLEQSSAAEEGKGTPPEV